MTFEEAIDADRETALSLSRRQDMRLAKAKQAADHVLHFLRDYIDEDRFRDAYGAFYKAMYESEVEVVTRRQMAELERCRDLIIKANYLSTLTAPVIIPADT